VTVRIWRIAVAAPAFASNDLSGEGARRSGGRWNQPGTPVVYCSSSIALAALETLAHLRGNPLPLNRYLIAIDIPDPVWKRRQTLTPPVGWDALPSGMASARAGQAWVAAGKTAILAVPSVIVPDEENYLLNPAHADIRKIRATALRKWEYDLRFF
jgi:RES domain-containing protein